MKDRFSTTEANTAMAKLRRMSLLSDWLRQGEFYLPFRKYTCSYWTRLVGKDLLPKRPTGLGVGNKRRYWNTCARPRACILLEKQLSFAIGAKLDFVREDVPNVRSLTFLSFYVSYAISLLEIPRQPPTLPSFFCVSLFTLNRHVLPPSGPRFFFFFHAEIPVSPETLDNVATLPYVPRYYAYFTDFYGISRRFLFLTPPLFLCFDYISFCFSVVQLFFLTSIFL